MLCLTKQVPSPVPRGRVCTEHSIVLYVKILKSDMYHQLLMLECALINTNCSTGLSLFKTRERCSLRAQTELLLRVN